MNLELSSFGDLYGRDHDPGHVHRELKFVTHAAGAGAIGAVVVSCSDESLNESSDRFAREFAQETLPSMKPGFRAPFRNITPGGIYVWGGARVAHANFATADLRGGYLLLLTKIEGHSAVLHDGQGMRFGRKPRYGTEGVFCGALNALLEDRTLPLLDDLKFAFEAEGKDRLGALREAPAEQRLLLAAATSARLMARNVAMDMQSFVTDVPTVHLIMHGVVLNREGADTEIVGGAYLLDRRTDRPRDRYRGLGDDPSKYVLDTSGPLRLVDGGIDRERDARDHRQLAAAAAERHVVPDGAHLDELRASVARVLPGTGPWGRALLRTSLAVLADVAPVPTALILLGEGLVEIRHAHRLSKAVKAKESVEDRRDAARKTVAAAERHIDELSDEEAAKLVERLVARVAPASA